jgi:hypothetical protein
VAGSDGSPKPGCLAGRGLPCSGWFLPRFGMRILPCRPRPHPDTQSLEKGIGVTVPGRVRASSVGVDGGPVDPGTRYPVVPTGDAFQGAGGRTTRQWPDRHPLRGAFPTGPAPTDPVILVATPVSGSGIAASFPGRGGVGQVSSLLDPEGTPKAHLTHIAPTSTLTQPGDAHHPRLPPRRTSHTCARRTTRAYHPVYESHLRAAHHPRLPPDAPRAPTSRCTSHTCTRRTTRASPRRTTRAYHPARQWTAEGE